MSRGYIRKRGRSYWITVSGGRDPITGERVQLYRKAATRKDAERELTQLLSQVDGGNVADAGKLTVADYLRDRWLPHQKTRVRHSTWTRYRQLLHRHVIPSIGGVKLSKLRPAHVQGVLDAMTEAGLAPRTTVQAYRVLSAALRRAVRWQLLGTNPAEAAAPPRPERAKVRVPSAEEAAAILGAGGKDWFRVALVLAATTGMRRGEVVGLRWPDVNLAEGTVSVNAALVETADGLDFVEPKTDRARRTIAIPPATVAELRRWRKDQARRQLLLGEAWNGAGVVVDRGDGAPVHPDTYSQRFDRLAERLGIGVRLHDLRHGFATTLLGAGVPVKVVSEALGHASAAFTMDVYQHVLPAMQEKAAEAIQDALGAAVSNLGSDEGG